MSALIRAWDELWFGPVSRLRVWLMIRATTLMLALDTWLLMIERGGRYGAGGFNVAHFAWLDGLQPIPSSGFYVGLILTCGLLSMLITLGLGGQIALGLLTLLYTYGWAMSQLDSYQHHVFISWVLLCFSLIPWLSTRDALEKRDMICAWGYRLLVAICALLYVFTGISKTEPEWLSGSVLKRINSAGAHLEPFREAFLSLGLEEETFWTLSGHSVVLVQLVIAATWLSLLVFGERANVWVRMGRLIGVLSAGAFHIGAEVVGLRIGWFSWYMLGMTCVAFLPHTWLERIAQTLHRGLTPIYSALEQSLRPTHRWMWWVLHLFTALGLWLVSRHLDLPGSERAGLLWVIIAILISLKGSKSPQRLSYNACAIALSSLLLFMSIQEGRSRYDFYRFVGGDALRRGEFKAALFAYGRANTYAPEGEGRWKKVQQTKVSLKKAAH